jgi:hypothetical protein
MGKNKGGGNKQRPPQPSFFVQQQQKLGTGFMNRINTEFVRKNALKIFKDLACGAINPDTDCEYFAQYDFTYNLAIAANDNAKYRYYIWVGLTNNPQYQYDAEMQRVAAEVYDQMNTYNTIVIHLNNILQDITMSNGVYIRFYLQQLIAEIRWKRNAFNGLFVTLSQEDDKLVRQKRRQIQNDQGYGNEDERGFFQKPYKDNM